MKKSVPTLEDVARLAGVSTATVSRCLNEPAKLTEDRRRQVQAAIDALGYTPNFAARSMAARRTFTIGAIIPMMENAIFARGLQAFQEALSLRGYTLLVSSSAYEARTEEEQIRNLAARGADGLLVIGHDRDPAIYDYLVRRRVPVLVAWSYDETARMPSIGFDNRAAMRALGDMVTAGFDDIELAQVTTPELTTVHVPHRDMGRISAEELVAMIEEKRPGVSRKLEAHVVERASVAPPRD